MNDLRLPPVNINLLLHSQNEEFVTGVYINVLGRQPDPEGLVHHLELIKQGTTKLEIIRRIHASEEGRHAAAKIDGLQIRLAVQSLSKMPIIGALFKAKKKQFIGFPNALNIDGESGSGEVVLKRLLRMHGKCFITKVYISVLGRQPDHEGLQHHLNLLRSGVSKLEIVRRIRFSQEGKQAGKTIDHLDSCLGFQYLCQLPVLGLGFLVVSKLFNVLPPEDDIESRILASVELTAIESQAMQLSISNLQDSISRVPTHESRFRSDLPVQPAVVPIEDTSRSEPAQATTADADGLLQLLEDRSVDEISWLRYLRQVIENRLLIPLRRDGTPPPQSALFVVVDCTATLGSAADRNRTRVSLSSLFLASEYPVKMVWFSESNAALQIISADNEAPNLSEVIDRNQLEELGYDNDIFLVLKPGDEVRAEIHMALKYFGAFSAEITIIDMYFRENNRIFPLLLHAVDPVHATYCDYFLGRYATNSRIFKQVLKQCTTASPGKIGQIICARLRSNTSLNARRIAVPLLCIQTSNEELASLRKGMVVDPAGSSNAPYVNARESYAGSAIRIRNVIDHSAKISVVICTKDCGLLLRQLMYRLDSETLIGDIVIVSNNTSNVYAIRTLAIASLSKKVTILSYPGPFNFSSQCNLGAKYAKNDTYLFLNDDITPVTDNWLSHLNEWMDAPQITGPMLVYPDESVQHAGMSLGFNGVAGHVLRRARLPSGDYGFLLSAPRRVSCLTGAALMMPKSIFSFLNGFDPLLATYLQDVDLSLRAVSSGIDLVFDPRSILMHMESVSVSPRLSDPKIQRTRELEFAYFEKRWGNTVKNDAWMNPLFSPHDESLTVLRV